MLNSMRSIASGFIAKALLLFLVVTFGVWGIGDIFRNSGASYAARVGDTTISVAEFEHSKSVISRQMQAMGIQNADPSQLQVGILRQLVQQQLILQATDDLGLSVNEKLLAESLKTLPQFQTLDGKFSGSAFKAALTNLHMNEAQFLAQLKNETAGKFLLASLEMNDVTPPASVLDVATIADSEVRDAAIITIPAVAPATPPTDAELKTYYEQNKATLFMQPESRTIEYLQLDEGSIVLLFEKAITLEIRQAAEVEAVKRHKEHDQEFKILYARAQVRDQVMREISNKIEDNMAGGSSPGEAIAKTGVKATSQLLSSVKAGDEKTQSNPMLKTVIEQGLRMNEGETSNIISAPGNALLVVSVKTLTPAKPKPFAEVADKVTAEVNKLRARDEAQRKAGEFKTKLTLDPNWKTAAASLQLTATPVNNLPHPVEGAPNSYTAQVPLAMQQAIFEREVGKVAGPLTLDNGGQMIAVVLASRHVAPSLSGSAQQKVTKQIADSLNQRVQARAFTVYAEQHKVTINPAIMRSSDGEQ